MRKSLTEFVWRRAYRLCKYCRLPSEYTPIPFEIDHVVPRKHGGKTVASNLALACFYCNNFKGPNLAGIDHFTDEVVRLFRPRADLWNEHFEWDGAVLVPRTSIGRATVDVLKVNHPEFVAVRETLMGEGHFPPV